MPKGSDFLQESSTLPFGMKAMLTVGSSAVIALAFHLDYELETDRAAQLLPDIAVHRNVCELQALQPLSGQAGSLAFKLTVKLRSGTLPEASDSKFDALSTRTTFRDGARSAEGLIVAGSVDAPIVQVYGDPKNDPDGPTNTAVILFDAVPPADATYHVYRRNSVTTETRLFWLIDHQATASGLVPCGALPQIAP